MLITVAVVSGTARAEDAQALFDEGLSDMRAGRFKIGCALIKQSLEIDARPGTLFTLAECYSKAGKYASAMEHYDRYLTVFDGMPADQQQSQEARADLSRSERTRLVALVAWLRVSVPDSAPPGIVATMDGEPFPAGLFGAATAVDPGPHVFTTRAPDGPLVEQRIDIAPGERRSLILALRTSNGAPPTSVDPGTPSSSGQGPEPDQQPKHGVGPWVWVAGGVGAAGLITGGITGAMLLGDRSTILKDCPNHVCKPNTSGQAAVNRAQNTLAPMTTVALSVGAAGALTAIILL
ncbi:MAG TPA: hypothetical protein VF395_14545, partial [Polyangiaceae bacterium]